ncbi:NADP(H)-dependent aldo-keto reductase [Tenacibaculum maritimum]|uniref:NADP(H)-dependent aldo-keto reductase n=1 Tax=Tenacibaculum maritimum TaxID=107401 RepID=UPI00132FA361|nr:NADP(H)-dependent aldo-keto reductase [Tenacibaculum maritimum]MCD9562143.1 NADP(H)-dependent aldo-keto reductase [Tenacibaculum maritimum]MCD9565662.1 NADP(H)-dependent aldo-keto reductase [Tenacibaculum maritimum]MCD9578531.1 NADP(H)-dependent aldo-keto reductase [Tenacibaculum maritimum]MCD9596412.1 NADP(H)-dependent aldo-keto reductase [Tenacibaculum maritimum]MCD9612548.1 NADP(H)-dependent aldo-keto reductase [Tenacibaculum maritimum]
MKYTTLPNTTIKVSKICLGTMTWGKQNTEAEGHEQMDYALEQGVNFFDTAELYSVPATPETYGATEKIIGSWFKKTGNRDKVILASKIAGGGDYTAHIRKDGFSKRAIAEAIENSLQRLQTDYIDLYQLHWPERGVNCFGVRDYPYKTTAKEAENHLEILETLNSFVKQGKIRQIGLSNETPWGTMKYLQTAKQHNLLKPVTIQNSYSLIHRAYEYGMSEVSLRENIGLLAYSPLAQGVLSGKYLGGKTPEGARGTLFPRFIARYTSEGSQKAVREYQRIAVKNGLTLSELALAYINQLPFVTSNIIGATKMSQLKENINSIHMELSSEILNEIEAIHALIPNPAP